MRIIFKVIFSLILVQLRVIAGNSFESEQDVKPADEINPPQNTADSMSLKIEMNFLPKKTSDPTIFVAKLVLDRCNILLGYLLVFVKDLKRTR